jgi:hypothetical protein
MPLPQIQDRPLATTGGFTQTAGAGEAAQANLFAGLAEGAMALRKTLQPMLDEAARQQAARDVRDIARARENGETAADTPLRRVLTQQDQVYNQTARAGTAAIAKNDFDAAARQMEMEFEFDPQGFEQASSAFLQKYSESLDTDMVMQLQLETEAQGLFDTTRSGIEARQRQAVTKEAQQALEARLDNLQAKRDTLIEQEGAGAVLSPEWENLILESENVIGILTANPAYGWSEERAAQALDGIANAGQELIGKQEIAGIYYKPADQGGGVVGAMGHIDKVVDRMDLTDAERIGMRSRLQGELNWLVAKDAAVAKADKDAEKALKEAGEKNAAQYEALLLEGMAAGEPPSLDQISNLRAFVEAGWMKPSRMQVFVNAATSTSPTQYDEVTLALMFDSANDPDMTREDIEQLTLSAMANPESNISASDRQRVLAEFDKVTEKRYKVGSETLEGYFASGFMDVDSAAVRAARTRASEELRDWAEEHPDYTRRQIEDKAKSLAVEAGRRMPRPPKPAIPNYSHPVDLSADNLDQWSKSARVALLDAFENGGVDESEFARQDAMIDEYVAWQNMQTRLAQEAVRDAE